MSLFKQSYQIEAEQIGDSLYELGHEKAIESLEIIHTRLIKRHQIALNDLRKFNKK